MVGMMAATSPTPKTLTAASTVSILLIITTIKILLIPSYFSTDFDVHRNWLAITRHLDLNQWYFDDVGGQTVHTLDYPPGFAWFEYALSNNFITSGLIQRGWVDERCLELLPDTDNEPSERCLIFHRCTVILSDVMLFLGAYLASHTYAEQSERGKEAANLAFLLIVTNPGLIILDHIHFQYNGMLLGILLCSIACIIKGSSVIKRETDWASVQIVSSDQTWELCGAALYALLLSMKHLYMTLAPLYLVYLLRHHCYIARRSNASVDLQFSLARFIPLAIITLLCFMAPFIPFLAMRQMDQILKRLFPFNRGLVHDYWAANIWAIYLFFSRIVSFFVRQSVAPIEVRKIIESYSLVPFPEPSPPVVAMCLLLGLAPALIYGWTAAGGNLTRRFNSSSQAGMNAATFFIHAVVFSSFSAFMLGYHVHEKAIMTVIIPMTILSTRTVENARLFIRTCMFGLFGLLPLLYRTEELLVKSALFSTWMLFAMYGLESLVFKKGKGILLTHIDVVIIVVLSCVFIFMEIIHPLVFLPSGRLEFLPLMTTSVVCSIGLLFCWFQSGAHMIRCHQVKTKGD